MSESNIMVIQPIEMPETASAVKLFPVHYEFIDSKNKRMVRYLSDAYEVHEVPHGDPQPKKLRISLTDDHGFIHKFDVGLAGVSEANLEKWASEHPLLIDPTGFIPRKNNRLSPPAYEITFMKRVAMKSFSDDDEITKVFFRFSALTPEQKNSIAIIFGLDPTGMKPEVMSNKLVGLVGGIITSNPANRTRFLTKFEDMFDEVTLNFKAALISKVIVQTDHDVYLIASSSYVLGSETHSIAALRSREDLRNIVYRDLEELDMLQRTSKPVYEISEEESIATSVAAGDAFSTAASEASVDNTAKTGAVPKGKAGKAEGEFDKDLKK